MATRTILDWFRQGREVDAEMYKLSAYLGHKIATGTYCNPAFRVSIHISVSSEQIRSLLQNCHQHGGQVVCEPWASSWSSIVADPGVPGSEPPSPPSVFCAASCRFHSSTRRRSSRSRTMCALRMAAWQCRRWAGFRCVGEAAIRIPTGCNFGVAHLGLSVDK